jgi:hypothetical protein
MVGICGFMVVHVALVILVPKTMLAMVFGTAAEPKEVQHGAE